MTCSTKRSTRADITSEDQLVLLLARGELAPPAQEQAGALLAAPLRWDLILARAIAHEVYPLLYRNLRRLGFPEVPAQVCTVLEGLSKINAFRNTLLAEELARVLALLAGAGIPTIPLKGVTLAEALHGDPTLRVCADIDILVPRRMVAQAFHLLLTRGYKAELTKPFFADLFFRRAFRSGIEYTLVRQERWFCYLLELHWGILYGAPFDGNAAEDLWAEAHPKAFFGVSAYILSPEWDLLFLAAHAARHQWQGLKWLVDIHEVCCRGEVDWERVWEKARSLGWEAVLRLTLSAVHILFSTPIPEAFSVGRLPSWLKLFPDVSSAHPWQNTFFPLHLLKRPSAQLGYLTRLLLVPTLAEMRLYRLPSSLRFLYYPLRPLRLGCKWGWRMARAVWQRQKA